MVLKKDGPRGRGTGLRGKHSGKVNLALLCVCITTPFSLSRTELADKRSFAVEPLSLISKR